MTTSAPNSAYLPEISDNSHRITSRFFIMPSKNDAWRDRPSAGQSGSTSAAFVFSTESPQHAQPTPSRNGSAIYSKPGTHSAAPQAVHRSSTTNIPTSNGNDGVSPTSAGAVADQVDQLEYEVVHFMNLSLEEKEKAEMLSGRLESVRQEKEDLERQVDELDQELSRNDFQGQDNGASPFDEEDRISRLHFKITTLRTTAQTLESDLNTLSITSEQHTKTIAELEEELRIAREQLSQKTQEEERLRKESEQARVALGSEKKTNEEMRARMMSTQQECNQLRTTNALTSKKLAEAEQTADTLSGLVKRKVAEMEGMQKAGATQAETTRQELERKQKEIEKLQASKIALEASCAMSESALRNVYRPNPIVAAARSQREKDKDATIQKLTAELKRNRERRVRAVAIGIDLSGSAAGSLTEGIKKIYTHFLAELQRSPYQTYVMTVVHGPGNTVAVKSKFSDTWATHEKVLEGQQADGMEQHVECLKKIKEVAVETGLVLDFQVVLLGDSNTNRASHVGSEELCHDFKCSYPTVHIHSLGVKTGSAEEKQIYWNNLERWHPWNYASATGGNMFMWWQNSPLPDLNNLVY